MKRVVVLGAGLSGLAAAWAAKKRGADVLVLEAGDRVGGAVGTETIDGFRVERGADGFLGEKPEVGDLARELGIEGRLIRTTPRPQGAYVVKRGALLPIPKGFQMMAPLDAAAFAASPILSPAGRARALAEVVVPKGKPTDGNDESLASFVTRRFGRELLDRLAQPLVSGIYGADAEKLSLRATMPRFLNEERRYGSVTLGLRERARQAGGAASSGVRYGLFASFDDGMQVLVDALADAVGRERIRVGTKVEAASPGAVRACGETLAADAVVCALPLAHAPSVLEGAYPEVATRLRGIPLGSCAIVVLGFDREVVPARADGYGWVVPKIEGRVGAAGTLLSRKWRGRAPAGKELLRVFLRDDAATWDDERALGAARDELRELLGVTEAPSLVRVFRYHRAMPQYHVGHEARARALAAEVKRHAGLHLAGNALFGVGIPDAIRVGLTEGAAAAG